MTVLKTKKFLLLFSYMCIFILIFGIPFGFNSHIAANQIGSELARKAFVYDNYNLNHWLFDYAIKYLGLLFLAIVNHYFFLRQREEK